MEDSIAHPAAGGSMLEAGGWKTAVSLISAVILAGAFLFSGVPKLVFPFETAARMMQAKVPAQFSMLAALGFGAAEVLAAVLIVVPRFRRWGAWLASGLLVVFMIYIGIHYNELRGEDCSCFPWLKETVSPLFFARDGALLALAVAAGWWSRPSWGLRSALVIAGAIAVLAGVSYGASEVRLTGAKAPDTIVVDGRPLSLQYGKVFLFFFDPQCLHCYQAAKKIGKYSWQDVKVIALPARVPEFAKGFLEDTGFKASISSDYDKLRSVFQVPESGPTGVVLENGRAKATIREFDTGDAPAPVLRQLHVIQ